MENNATAGTETQGVEEPKKKQAISKSYLIRSFGQNIGKLETLGLVSEKDGKDLRRIHKEVMENYIKESMAI